MAQIFNGGHTMKLINTFASSRRRFAIRTLLLDDRAGRTPRCAAIAIRVLCLTLAVVFAATAAVAQSANSTTAGWVVLPVAEYTALRHAAFPAEPESMPPPVDATLSRID